MATPPPELEGLDLAELRALVKAQQERLESREVEVERLTLLLRMRRMQFGRRSEKVARRRASGLRAF